jgi:hypothetical protein
MGTGEWHAEFTVAEEIAEARPPVRGATFRRRTLSWRRSGLLRAGIIAAGSCTARVSGLLRTRGPPGARWSHPNGRTDQKGRGVSHLWRCFSHARDAGLRLRKDTVRGVFMEYHHVGR